MLIDMFYLYIRVDKDKKAAPLVLNMVTFCFL